MIIRIACCDDNLCFLEHLRQTMVDVLSGFKVQAEIFTFTNGMELMESMNSYVDYYDIIFLDLDMPMISGKELAGKLRILDKKFKLIFITSYLDEMLNTYQYFVFDYIPKSMFEDRITDTLKRLVDMIQLENEQVQVFIIENEFSTSIIRVPLVEIVYFEVVKRRVIIHTVRNQYMLYKEKIIELKDIYQELGFLDVHRTCLVNFRYVYAIDEDQIRMNNGECLPLSRRKRTGVLEQLAKTIRERI